MQETKSRPQSGILILVASWPSTSKIWSPSSNFSGQSDKNFDLFLRGFKIVSFCLNLHQLVINLFSNRIFEIFLTI
jgi:hypothetical protein